MLLAATFVDWLSAVATTAAVVVALGVAFLPMWHDKRQRPLIHLKVAPKGSRAPVNWWTAGGMRLRIHNAPGKRTAEQVEIFASLATRETGDDSFWGSILLQDEALNFDDPGGAPPGRATTSVPSGFSRPASFLMVGPPAKISERYGVEVSNRGRGGELPVWVAVPALYPAVTESAIWFPIGRRVEVTLVVTGANFDAVTFRGEFAMSEEAGEDDRRDVVYEWTKPPTELREVAAFASGPFR